VRRLYLAIAVAGAVAVGVFVAVYSALPAASQTQLAFEVGKAAVGVLPVALFGLLVNEVVKERDAERVRAERERDAEKSHAARERDAERARAERDQDVRHEFRRRAIDAYSQTKAIRRALRGAGLRPDSRIALTPELLAVLDAQVSALGAAQLVFERLKREMESKTAPFRDRVGIREYLLEYERELAGVVHEWEDGRPGLKAGTPASALGRWDGYTRFVADRSSLSSEPSSRIFQQIESAFLSEIDAVAE
jgi:hypothetical protein